MSEDAIKLASKIELRVKQRDKLAVEIQADIDLLAAKIHKFTEHDLRTYELLPDRDCLYNDSPISKFFVEGYLKQYMIKKDMDFIGIFIDGKINIKSFVERMSDASKWVLRFTKEKEKPKSGIEAIL